MYFFALFQFHNLVTFYHVVLLFGKSLNKNKSTFKRNADMKIFKYFIVNTFSRIKNVIKGDWAIAPSSSALYICTFLQTY